MCLDIDSLFWFWFVAVSRKIQMSHRTWRARALVPFACRGVSLCWCVRTQCVRGCGHACGAGGRDLQTLFHTRIQFILLHSTLLPPRPRARTVTTRRTCNFGEYGILVCRAIGNAVSVSPPPRAPAGAAPHPPKHTHRSTHHLTTTTSTTYRPSGTGEEHCQAYYELGAYWPCSS